MAATLSIVWFKRDLRLRDHAALAAAAARGPVLGLVVYEPSQWGLPDSSGRHAAFYWESLQELCRAADRAGLTLFLAKGEMPALLESLRQALGPFALFSHEETGNGESYARDQRVARWCKVQGISWTELPQNNVVRRLRNRDHWASIWEKRMAGAAHSIPVMQPLEAALQRLISGLPPGVHIDHANPWLERSRSDHCPGRQPGGRQAGKQLLQTFLQGRGLYYRGHMSSPGTSENSCSRLSPHLTWGTLSIREVVHALKKARADWLAQSDHPHQRAMLASLKSFESRLYWRCHFIQKLESEPEIEFRCLHPATRNVRNEGALTQAEQARLEAWCRGRTGYPFVDACMRYLQHCGWINFRMRAMLTSFASHHLWLHWRATGEHLARLYTDYEPGIHWPQMQMQSGTTGINTIRIYNPDKQAADQDPSGVFTAAWVPERFSEAYPAPIVEQAAAAKAARDRLWGLRKSPISREQARAVQAKHGSRGAPQGPQSTRQGELEF